MLRGGELVMTVRSYSDYQKGVLKLETTKSP